MQKFAHILLVTLLGLHFSVQGQNSSLNFDGTDDIVQLPKNNGILGSNFTIEGWFKTAQIARPQAILIGIFDPQINAGSIGIEVQADGFLRFVYNPLISATSFVELYSTSAINDGQWHHFAYVKEENRILKMYIDGILDNVICINQVNVEQPIFIELGWNRFANLDDFRFFRGNLDDIKIWSIVKSGRQILEEFQREHDGSEPNLFSNYKFDEPSDTIFDCSIQKKHGLRKGNSGANLKPKFSNDIPSLVDANCTFGFVGTNEEFEQSGSTIRLFPNPTTEELTISLQNEQDADAQIFNIEGRLMMQFKISTGVKMISTAALPPGIYEVRITSRDEVSTAKILKE